MELDEAAIEAFLAKYKASDSDKRVDQVQYFGLQLESTPSLPESTLDAVILNLTPSLRSPNHLLVQSTLNSFLPFFLPHLPTESTRLNHLRFALVQFLPPLLEKLNDAKDKLATPARTSLGLLGKKCFEAEAGVIKDSSGKGKEKESLISMWERHVKDGALAGRGKKGKIEGMKLIVELKGELGAKMGLKPWLATLVELLEDGDASVREVARETLVALVSPSTTPPGARTELKRLLQARQVRASIADNIITRVFSAASAAATPVTELPPALDDGTTSNSRSGAATPAGDDVAVVYVASARDLDGEFARMLPCFQGKEDEHNWNPREKAIIRVRGMLRGQAFQQFPDAFVSGLKAGFFEGLSRTVVSLRTTVAQQSCALLQELAEHLGSSLDPFVETLLPVLAKMAGYTKKLIADKSQRVLATILKHSTAHPRLFIAHIHTGIHDKNIQTRHYSTTHLKTFLDMQATRTRSTIENTSGSLDQLVESVKKALGDVHPGVREGARPAYWSFHAVWPNKASAIVDQLDATQKKQLDKVRPNDASPIPIAPPPIGAAKKSSGIGALLAEKRKAAMAARQETQRTVSSPVPGSPSLAQTRQMPRSTSNQSVNHAESSRNGSSPARSNPKPAVTPSRPSSSTHELLRTTSGSSAGKGSPAHTPLRPYGSMPSNGAKSSSSSSTSSGQALRTPVMTRKALSPQPDDGPLLTPEMAERMTTTERVVQEAQAAQAAQGVMSAQQLLEVDDDDGPMNPVTPMRSTRSSVPQSSYLQTPVNGLGRNVWEDSPGPSAVTPVMMDKLMGRRYERSWWLKRQQYLDKASPFKTAAPAPASAVEADIAALEAGSPELRNLQKLTLFSTSHPITQNDEDESQTIWSTNRLFDRVFDGLITFLKPYRDIDVLEHGLVLLWEMVQHQWMLVEDKESMLVDALFGLRSTRNPTILESTNSLISLMTEISDPVYLLGLLRASLDRYISSHHLQPGDANGETSDQIAARARASGYLFGLNAIGMCVLRLPAPVIEIEAPKLTGAIMDATSDTSSVMLPARQAAHHLLLSIQCVLKDAQKTLGVYPNLSETQKNLAMYLMGQNGLLPGGDGTSEQVAHEMAGLMSRGAA